MQEMLQKAINRTESPQLEAVKVEEVEHEKQLELTDKQIPELKDWSVGKTYTITLTVKQKSMEQKPDGSICGEFSIESVDKTKMIKDKKEEKPEEPKEKSDPMIEAYVENNS